MLPIERLETIKQIVLKEKKVFVSILSEKLNVTEETIRRDLDKLEEHGILIRSYGGAVVNKEKINANKSFDSRIEDNFMSEKYIAKKAVELIKEGTTIIADSSLIVFETLKLVTDKNEVTVITNSIEALKELSQTNLNLISTGGSVNQKTQSLQGNMTKEVIKNYNVDIALINCNGLKINGGILDLNEEEVEIKKRMIRQANKAVLLVESIKFDKISLVKLLDYGDIDCIITDSEPKEEWMTLFLSLNIEVIY